MQIPSLAVAIPLDHLIMFKILWSQKSRTLLLKVCCLKLNVLEGCFELCGQFHGANIEKIPYQTTACIGFSLMRVNKPGSNPPYPKTSCRLSVERNINTGVLGI